MSREMEILLVPCGEPSALNLGKLCSYLSPQKKFFDSKNWDIHPNRRIDVIHKRARQNTSFFKSLTARKLPFQTGVLIEWMEAGVCDD